MNQVTASSDKLALALQDKLDRLLAKNKPSKRERTQNQFRDLYPRLESHLAQRKPLKDVLAAFNELTQSKVCVRTFNEMLDQERSRRNQHGDLIACTACGQPLTLALPERSSAAASLNTPGSAPATVDQE